MRKGLPGRCQQLTPPETGVLGDHFHNSEQHVIFIFNVHFKVLWGHMLFWYGRCQQLTPPENGVLGDHFHTSEQHVIFAFLLAYIQARSLKKTLRKLDSIRSLLYEQLRRRPKHRFSQNHTLHTMHTQKHARTAQKTIFSPARKSRPRA